MYDPEDSSRKKELIPEKGRLVAFAFKIINDAKLGLITYFKVYSGELKTRATVYNASIGKEEKLGQLLRMRANEYQEVKSISQGDIVAALGVKETSSGQTIVGYRGDAEGMIMTTLLVPKPVFMSSLNMSDERQKEKLFAALSHLNREDPSFSFEEDQDTNQLVVKGFGELHLEIMKDRLRSEYGLETYLSKLRVALKETVKSS